LMGCGNAIHFTIEYDVKEVIPLFIIVFDWLNPIVEAFVAPCDEPTIQVEKMTITCLVLELPIRSLCMHLLLQNFIYFGVYVSHNLCV
jgi:hypothetical protein